jgi:hypothetical protein
VSELSPQDRAWRRMVLALFTSCLLTMTMVVTGMTLWATGLVGN